MTLIAWTAALAVYAYLLIFALLAVACIAPVFTTGRTRMVIQVVLALLGLAVAVLVF